MNDPPVQAWIGLGSNLGDRVGHLRAARTALAAAPGVVVVGSSSVYESAAVGPGVQGSYLNAVLAIETTLEPSVLLDLLLRIERDRGRDRSADAVRWGPRTLDLDLLIYAERCIATPEIEVPHPRLHQRAFVLEPLCELAGDRIHPRLGGRLAEWAARCDGRSGVHRRRDLDPGSWTEET